MQGPGLSRAALVSLVVGSMIGSGIFALPAAFARVTGGLGAILAWVIAGTGMLMLALVFQTLSRRRPDLDTGIYAYAKAGFGNYLGFIAASGYWIGCCLADVACLVLIKATLGKFFPVFGDGSTAVAIASASALVWGVHVLVLRGVKEAAALNTIATVAKVVPIVVFLFVAFVGFRSDIFALNFWGGAPHDLAGVGNQVRDTMLVTVFVFVGIEGASVYSRHARNRDDVGIATVLGFIGVLCLLVMVTMLSFGVLLRPELAALPTPSVAGVMAYIVGPWGLVFISIGLLISILGNYLSWSLLAAEVLHSAARTGTMPAFLARENRNGVPAAALWLSNIVIQAFLLVTWFAEYAFTLALKMTSSMTLFPYLLVAAFGLKLAWSGATYAVGSSGAAHSGAGAGRTADGVRAAFATVYAAGMLYAGGPTFLLLAAVLYAPGTLLYFIAMREQGVRIFRPAEMMLFATVVAAALVAVWGMANGTITV